MLNLAVAQLPKFPCEPRSLRPEACVHCGSFAAVIIRLCFKKAPTLQISVLSSSLGSLLQLHMLESLNVFFFFFQTLMRMFLSLLCVCSFAPCLYVDLIVSACSGESHD